MPTESESFERGVIDVIRSVSAEVATHRANTEQQLNLWNSAIRQDLNRAIAAINSHIVSIDKRSAEDAEQRKERQKILDERLENINRYMRYLSVAVIIIILLSVVFIALMIFLLIQDWRSALSMWQG